MSWQPRRLDKCAKFSSGGTPSKANAGYWVGDIPWVSSGEMGESFINDTQLHLSAEGAANGTRIVPKHTVLAVVRGMSLAKEFRISITQREMTFNQDIKALHCADDVDPHFLFYALKARKNYIRELATEASHGTKKLETDTLGSVEILVPRTLEAQKAAASIALNYDDLIENNRRRIALLEEAARQLYKEWFVRFRFPGHEHVKIIDGVPEGWERLTASEAIFINPTTRWLGDGEICSVPMAAVSEQGMCSDEAHFERRLKSTSVRFVDGDTLFARITPCLENGKTAFVNFLAEGEVACGSSEFIVFRERAISRFAIYLLAREDSFRANAIKSMIGSSGRQRVQPSCFEKYMIAVPPRQIGESFDEEVRPMFNHIRLLDRQNTHLARARDLLLPKLMSGAIAV